MEKFTSMLDEPLLEQQTTQPERRKKRWAWTGVVSSIWLPAVLVYTAVVLTLNLIWAPPKHPLPVYSPANVALKYEISNAWDLGEHSQWLHGTQAETDSAWASLVNTREVRVLKQDMYRTQEGFDKVEDAMQLADGDYLGTLGVYHTLHCLSVMRIALNAHAYNVTDPLSIEFLKLPHLYHCIDAIRAQLMCQPDLTVYYGYWMGSHEELRDRNIRSKAKTQCVNWDSIAEWTARNALHKYTFKPNPYDNV